jgi:hypothetical protein
MALRPDGSCLAFLVENRAGLPTVKIEGVFEEFTTLSGESLPAT